MTDSVEYENLGDGRIARIWLNRPEAQNAQSRTLLVQLDEAFKRAEAVFSREGGTRQEVIARYRAEMKGAGDPVAGAATFKKVCATCHRLGNEGT